ncbi:sodium-dependent bicarbonate transport family permease [Parvibaculum sp.]|uniref:sodium-dependent bicarbonate transport family permease n=1 Tax=Parvibaculum sp. TaxID=2024848 RepID=UPI003520748A
MSILDLALQNIVSPMVLFFALGVAAALIRSDLSVPEAAAKLLALYLMLAIGFKGGAEVAKSGIDAAMALTVGAGILLSFLIPVIGYALLRLTTRLSVVDAAAVAGHYGSISIVTFVAATEALKSLGLAYEGYLIAVAAVMETPAIIAALLLARRGAPARAEGESTSALLREVGTNGSVVVLVGSFLIGWATGTEGMAMIAPFIVDPFRGILCLFLLDMGLVAGRGLRQGGRSLSPSLIGFGIYFPLVSAALTGLLALTLGLSVGGTALLITLAASASYIAVPAAMRLALPEANPAIYLTLSLGVTFPFNLTLGIPLYAALAQRIAG